MVAVGQACPAFELDAAVSGRKVNPAAFAGRTAVLVLHGAGNTDAAKEVSKAIRPAHKASAVYMASIVDLKSMAGLFKRVAEAQVKVSYEKLAGKVKEMDPAADPADYVIIAPDWTNTVGPLFGVEAPGSNATVVVIGKDGHIKAVLAAKDAAAQVGSFL